MELAAAQAATSTVSQNKDKQIPFAPVRFSLNSLRERLASRGKAHTVAGNQKKGCLSLKSRAEISLDHPLGAAFEDYANYLVTLHFRGEKTDESNIADTCIAYLNPVATSTILKMKCWPIDNDKLLRLNSDLARWLITRISNRYRQADQANVITGEGYHLALSTILTESGIVPEKRLRNSIDRVRAAIERTQRPQNISTTGNPLHGKTYSWAQKPHGAARCCRHDMDVLSERQPDQRHH